MPPRRRRIETPRRRWPLVLLFAGAILAGVALLGRDHPLVSRCVRWLPEKLQQKLKGTKS